MKKMPANRGYKRQLKNYIINRDIQVRLLALMLTLLIALGGTFSAICYYHLSDLYNLLASLDEISPTIREILADRIANVVMHLGTAGLLFLTLTSLFVIMESHRIAGAAFAICRHVRENFAKGKFAKPIKLRQRDLLHDIADELNKMAVYVQANYEHTGGSDELPKKRKERHAS